MGTKMLHHPPLLRENGLKTKTTFLIKKMNILLILLYTVQNVKTACTCNILLKNKQM